MPRRGAHCRTACAGGPRSNTREAVRLRLHSVYAEDVAAALALGTADESSDTALATVDLLWSNI